MLRQCFQIDNFDSSAENFWHLVELIVFFPILTNITAICHPTHSQISCFRGAAIERSDDPPPYYPLTTPYLFPRTEETKDYFDQLDYEPDEDPKN